MLTATQLKNRCRLAVSLATLPVRLAVPRTPEQAVDFVLRNYSIKSIQVPSELRRFSEIAQSVHPQSVVEIGTCLGETLYLLCKIAADGATIVSVDLPAAANGDARSFLSRPFFRMFGKRNQKVLPLRMDSHADETAQHVSGLLPDGGTDLLFIDGDHSYDGVKRDFELYSPLVRKGGLIAMHDIAPHRHRERDNCFVDIFWNEIKHKYRYTEIIENRSQGWAGIGVLHL